METSHADKPANIDVNRHRTGLASDYALVHKEQGRVILGYADLDNEFKAIPSYLRIASDVPIRKQRMI
jgi:hypothetical protein